ncbi:MAG: AI-2E family transporter [Nitrospiraceae bacterium]
MKPLEAPAVLQKRRHMAQPPSPSTKPVADRHLWEITALRDVLGIAMAASTLWIGYLLRGILEPLLIALILAYLVNPLVRAAERRWHVPRPVTITCVLVIVTIMCAGLIAWLGPTVSAQAQRLTQKTPDYLRSLSERYNLPFLNLPDQMDGLSEAAKQDPISALQQVFSGTSHAFGVIGTVIGATMEMALWVFLIPFYFFLLSWSFDRMGDRIAHLIPARRRDRTLEILRRMDVAVSGFFRGRFLIAVITGAMYAIGWVITDVPYWFLLGVGTGLLSIIPYVSVIGWPLAVLFKYLDGMTASGAGTLDWVAITVWPSLSYLFVQFVESWMLTPWIQSYESDMSAVTIVVAVLVGGLVGGLSGMILAIPLAACMKILLQEFAWPRLHRWAEEH